MGIWIDGVWIQNVQGLEDHLNEESQLSRDELLEQLTNHAPLVENQDMFVWMEENNKKFSVNSCYNYMQKIIQIEELEEELTDAFRGL